MKYCLLVVLLIIFVQARAQESQPGSFSVYYPNGALLQQGVHSATRKEGVLFYYSAEGALVKKVEYVLIYAYSGDYRAAEFKQKITEFTAEGEVRLISEYVNGKLVPKPENTYPNGQLISESIRDEDGWHTTTIQYYENGRVKSRIRTVLQGKRLVQDGQSESYYPNGQLASHSIFVMGVREGTHVSLDENGTLLDEFIYHNDTIIYANRFNKKGLPVSFWSRASSPEFHFNKTYFPGDSILKQHTYRKRILVDSTEMVYRFEETFDHKGNRVSIYVIDNVESSNLRMHYGTENIVGRNLVANSTFRLYREPYMGDTIFKLSAGYKVEQQGFYISNELRFPPVKSVKEDLKVIEDALQKTKKNVHDGKVYESHRVSDEMFDTARVYYEKFPKELFYKEAVIQTQFDSSMTGSYRIDYRGTDMYFIAQLNQGFLDGTAILYLNDNIRLFERNFKMGIEHGTSTDWFLDGKLASVIEYDRGKIRESKEYYTNGQLWKREVYNEKRMLLEKEVWSRDGKMMEFLLKKDSLNQQFMFNRDGSFNNYRWVDERQKISLGRSAYKDRFFASIDIPHEEGKEITFRIEQGGRVFEGKAYWDPIEKKAILEDNLGVLSQFDRSVITYPAELPCTCKGWEEYEFFAAPTSELVDAKAFERYQLGFHAPFKDLKGVFGDPYYLNSPPDNYLPGKTYYTSSTHFLVQPIRLFLPDSSGIQFILEPCKSRFAFIRLKVSTEFKIGSFRDTKVSFHDVKHVAMAFPENMMIQLDANNIPLKDPKGKNYPGMFLFTAKGVKYDTDKEINVTYPGFMPGRSMQLGTSGIVLQAENVYPDFSSTENYPVMETFMQANARTLDSIRTLWKIAPEALTRFRGAYIDEGTLLLPLGKNEKLKAQVANLLVSAEQSFGILRIPVEVIENGKYKCFLENDKTRILTVDELIALQSALGIKVSRPIAVENGHYLLIYFLYKPQ